MIALQLSLSLSLSLSAGLMLLVCASCTGNETTQPTEVEQVAPWIAVPSIARLQNPYAWVGDEHNRLMAVAMKAVQEQGIKGLPRSEKCRWLAEFILSELGSDRAPAIVSAHWRTRKFDPALFEVSTTALGCKAGDAPQTVAAAVMANTEEAWDTVEYAPSAEALSLAAQIENGIYSTSTVSEYDGVLSSVQAQANGLWDGEVVMVTSSVAASSAYYWQGYLGGSSGGEWTGGCPPPVECFPTVVADVPMANAGGRAIVGGDVTGALGIWIGNGFGWKMAVRLGARIFLSGGPGFALTALAGAALGSAAAAVL
jgi:hypothetical protein